MTLAQVQAFNEGVRSVLRIASTSVDILTESRRSPAVLPGARSPAGMSGASISTQWELKMKPISRDVLSGDTKSFTPGQRAARKSYIKHFPDPFTFEKHVMSFLVDPCPSVPSKGRRVPRPSRARQGAGFQGAMVAARVSMGAPGTRGRKAKRSICGAAQASSRRKR